MRLPAVTTLLPLLKVSVNVASRVDRARWLRHSGIQCAL